VFWTDPNNVDWMRSEVQKGRVRQGWGFEGCQLIDHGVLTPYEDWARSQAAGILRFWGEVAPKDGILNRYRILMRMLQLQRDDQLVIPSMPASGILTLARVRNGYDFDNSHFGNALFYKNNHSDFIHYIDIDPNKRTEIRYDFSPDAKFIASKFSYYRSAITFARAPEYRAAINRLFGEHLPI